MKTPDLLTKLFLCFALALVCIGCDEDDELNEPEGTILLSMMNRAQKNSSYWEIEMGLSYFLEIDGANNFVSIDMNENQPIDFATISEVNGLNSITDIPQNGWGKKAKVIKGYGYVGRYYRGSGPYSYIRIYVIDYITASDGSVIGAKIKFASLERKMVQGKAISAELDASHPYFGEWRLCISRGSCVDDGTSRECVYFSGGADVEFAFLGKQDNQHDFKTLTPESWSDKGIVFKKAYGDKAQVVNTGVHIARYKKGSTCQYTRIYVKKFECNNWPDYRVSIEYRYPWIPNK